MFGNFRVGGAVKFSKVEGQDEILARSDLASLDVLVDSEALQEMNGVSQQEEIKQKESDVIALYLEKFIIAILVFHSVEVRQHTQRQRLAKSSWPQEEQYILFKGLKYR